MEKEAITYGDLPEEGLNPSTPAPTGGLYCDSCGDGPYSATREDYPEASDDDDIYCPTCGELMDIDDSEWTDIDEDMTNNMVEQQLNAITASFKSVQAAYSEVSVCPKCDGPLFKKRGKKLYCLDCDEHWVDGSVKTVIAQTRPDEVGKDFGYDIKTCDKCGGIGCPACQSTGGTANPVPGAAANAEIDNAKAPETPQDMNLKTQSKIEKEAINYNRDGTLITSDPVTLTPQEASSIPFLSSDVNISDKFNCPDCEETKWLSAMSSCNDCSKIKCSSCMDTFTEYAGQCRKCASAARSPYLAYHLNDEVDSTDWFIGDNFLEGDVWDEEE